MSSSGLDWGWGGGRKGGGGGGFAGEGKGSDLAEVVPELELGKDLAGFQGARPRN